MKLSSIPQIYRNLNRAVEIFSVLSKYGLANWASRFDVEFARNLFKAKDGQALAKQPPERRIRLALTELGPTFIKLGQVLSTRPDLVGVALAQELEHLQEEAPADSIGEVRQTIESEFHRPIEELFAEFDPEPLASASIGQVHAARLHSGEAVVVKVKHRHVEDKVRVDLDIIAGLAQFAEKMPEYRNYRPMATMEEFRRTLLRELDFARERRNMQRFARNFRRDRRVRIPMAYAELCSSRVLTMERLTGIKLAEAAKVRGSRAELDEIARRGAHIFLEMIFTHGFFHADPHPGNIVILEGNVIGLFDFGMVGQVDERLREDIEDMLVALVGRDAEHLTSLIVRVGRVPQDLDLASLSYDVSEYVANYGDQPLNDFDFTGAINELTELIRRYEITLPPRIALLLKVLVMLEGMSRMASPTFNLMEVIRPYQRKLIMRRLSPLRRVRKLQRIYRELEHLAEVTPRSLSDILEQIQSGKFDVHLDHRGLEPSVNRLVMGLLTSALFLGSTIMLSQKVPPLVGDVSFVGTAGAILSLVLAMRLFWAISKSGRLD